jgi:hypothetical protein
MRRRPLPAVLLAMLAAATPARAETPAERASRQLQQGIRQDRAAEAGGPEGPRPPAPNPATTAIDADRRSIEPDVGRPEATGAAITGGERAATGGGPNPQR